MASCPKEYSSVVMRRLDVQKDEEYERLRAIHRRDERKARRTKEFEDLRQARKAQRLIFETLHGKVKSRTVRDFCTKLDVRQPLSWILWTIKGMLNNIQQLHSFRGLSIQEKIYKNEATEGYCTLQCMISTPQVSCLRVQDAAPPTFVPALDLLFLIGELNPAISNVNCLLKVTTD